MRIHIASLGCRLNQAEIQSVATRLRDRGHELVQAPPADVYIINTCAVTGTSERKTRKLIHRAQRACSEGGGGKVLVTGCSDGELIYGDDCAFIGNDYKYLIPDIVEDWGLTCRLQSYAPSRFDYDTPLRGTRTRAHLKIQDGCDKFCAYCIIPFVRGAPQNKRAQSVIDEFRKLVRWGFKEIVLTGVMIGNYRWEEYDLASLITALLDTQGEYRLHLSSINPDSVTERLISLMGHERMVKHLHLSLQSGCDTVLRRMNRSYRSEGYAGIVRTIRGMDPLFNFTTDLIVGFPGESDDEFGETISLAEEMSFSHIHTFRYSPRPGTAAASMQDTVPEAVKAERSAKVMALSKELKGGYYGRFVGRRSILLSESDRGGITTGFNEYYVPVAVRDRLERNRFYTVETTLETNELRLHGTIVNSQ